MHQHLLTRILLIGTAFVMLTTPAAAEIFKGVPDVIVCEVSLSDQSRTGRVLFYLDRQEDGSITTYTSLGAAPMQVRVSADGRIEQSNLGDCTGKTISDLRNEDRAFDLE